MKKFTKVCNWGGVVFSAILALSLMFISCDNPSDSDDDNPSPALPENVGENPIKKTIRLYDDDDKCYRYELKTDGTALLVYDDESKDINYTEAKLKYTWNEDTKTIHMKLEKISCIDELMYTLDKTMEGQLFSYDETCSKINEVLTVKKLREVLQKLYDEDKEYIEERYPDCDTYEDYEAEFVKEDEFESLNDWLKYQKHLIENAYKAAFGVQITYSYKITDGKMTLTEKFTGVKNMYNSECRFYDNLNGIYVRAYVGNSYASIDIDENDIRYDYKGILDTDRKTIDFKKSKRSESDEDYKTIGNVTATYTEDTINGTVTIKCEGKEYICEFEGQKFIQE